MKKWLAVLLWLSASALWAQSAQTAELGDFKLQSGETLRHCKLEYRTFGHLNADKSNAVLIPTWFGGISADWIDKVEENHLPDPGKYYVIVVDALANGQSSSPANSPDQPREKFPQVSIHDMVETQYTLLTQKLGINHLHAVMGISMGGMQTFEWVVTHPDFMDKAVPIVGSPRLAAFDLVLWRADLDVAQNEVALGHDGKQPLSAAIRALGTLATSTTADFNARHSREDVARLWSEMETHADRFDAAGRIRQLQAMMGLDVSAPFGGDMQKAAAAVKAKMLVVVATKDRVVTPEPAREFAKLKGAKLVELDSDCGHGATSCQITELQRAVDQFLAD